MKIDALEIHLTLLSIALEKQQFNVELPRAVLKERPCYICNNLSFRITHFAVCL